MANQDHSHAPEGFVDRVDDWPAKASATIVQYVGTVREKTTGPALSASRLAVYALAMVLIAIIVGVLALVLLVRVLVVATGHLPFIEQDETWLAYFILGALFMVPGLYLWRKKEA